MKFAQENLILYCPIALTILVFIFRMPVMIRPRRVSYKCAAKTWFKEQDHSYVFDIRLMKNGCYRCFIEQAPFLFGKRFSRYTIDYGYDKQCDRCYILCNRRIHSVEQAKELCGEWSNVNQYVIDSRRYNN